MADLRSALWQRRINTCVYCLGDWSAKQSKKEVRNKLAMCSPCKPASNISVASVPPQIFAQINRCWPLGPQSTWLHWASKVFVNSVSYACKKRTTRSARFLLYLATRPRLELHFLMNSSSLPPLRLRNFSNILRKPLSLVATRSAKAIPVGQTTYSSVLQKHAPKLISTAS